MSRGWESKNVENQQALREQSDQEHDGQVQAEQDQRVLHPTDDSAGQAHRAGVVELRKNVAADAEMKRRRQALELQRERVLSERTSSPHRRSALASALLEIEEKLGELGWTVHL